jgi:hypothetical protein
VLYRFLADVVMVLHGALLVFFLIGGFLAWRWPKVIWAHLAIAAWNFAIVVLDFGCPITASEKYFIRQAGDKAYAGGYIHHYLEGRFWPMGATPIAEKVGFALLIISYTGFFVVRHRRKVARREKAGAP